MLHQVESQAFSTEEIRNLSGNFLCFQLKHIGDFLMTLPALGFIRQARPNSRVGVVVSPAVAALAQSHPWVDEVFILDRSQGPLNNFKLARSLAHQDYDTALIFDGQTRSIITASLARLKHRVGANGLYPLGRLAFLFSQDIDLGSDLRYKSQAHRSQSLAALSLGLEPGPMIRPIAPNLKDQDVVAAQNLLQELPDSGPLVGLTLAGRQAEKSWPLSYFIDLSRRLSNELGARLFVTGGAAESPMAQTLTRETGGAVANFCGRTSLGALIALGFQSDLFITVDTGTSHLIALTDTPLISIFIWTSPAQWPPQSPLTRILCYDWALSRFSLNPQGGPWKSAPVITPEIVFQEALQFLTKK